MHLTERIEFWAKSRPGHLAVVSDDESLTYEELWRKSGNLASHLTAPALAVVGHKEPEMVAGFLAGLRAGIPFVPIDTSTIPLDRRAFMSTATNAVVVTPSTVQFELQGDFEPDTPADPTKPAYIIFTSGSTGQPKGVVVPVEALDAFVQSTIDVHSLPDHERWLNTAPWSFDLSVLDTWVGLATGGTVYTVPRWLVDNPSALIWYLQNTPVDNWVSTPSFADFALSIPNLAHIEPPKRFFFCGEVLKPSTVRALYELFPNSKVYNMYGPTEACCAVTSTLVTPEDAERDRLSCGEPYPTIEIEIDRGDNPSEDGLGEVILMGPQVALGYLGTRSYTFAERRGRRLYRTGDRGTILARHLFVSGRIDRQVKVNGYRIELEEIEHAIRALGAIDAAAIQLDDGSLKAVVRGMTASDVRAQLRDRLPSYMVPKRIVSVDQFPLTPNGKLDLNALRDI